MPELSAGIPTAEAVSGRNDGRSRLPGIMLSPTHNQKFQSAFFISIFEKNNMTLLDKYSNDIHKLCKFHKVKKLYVFGSVLTDRFSQKSDIDLIVDFDHMEVAQYADNYFDFKFSLEDILKHPIDLLEEKAIKNPYFREAISQNRQLLYGY